MTQKFKHKTVKEQRMDAGLGLIIDEMSRAMWNADKEYISTSIHILPLTLNMQLALTKFHLYCKEHHGG